MNFPTQSYQLYEIWTILGTCADLPAQLVAGTFLSITVDKPGACKILPTTISRLTNALLLELGLIEEYFRFTTNHIHHTT